MLLSIVTSANISNEPSLLKAKDVYSKFNGKIASLIDEDAINGVASTVVDLTKKMVKIEGDKIKNADRGGFILSV